jgi:hypothetical protein
MSFEVSIFQLFPAYTLARLDFTMSQMMTISLDQATRAKLLKDFSNVTTHLSRLLQNSQLPASWSEWSATWEFRTDLWWHTPGHCLYRPLAPVACMASSADSRGPCTWRSGSLPPNPGAMQRSGGWWWSSHGCCPAAWSCSAWCGTAGPRENVNI